jgi:hypothetical protein
MDRPINAFPIWMFLVELIPLGIFVLAFIIVRFISYWKIYQKAGYEGWECLVPFYRLYIRLKIVGKPGWWLFLMWIPIAGAYWYVWMTNMLSKSFGKDEGYTIGLVLVGHIFYPIMGFSNNIRYQGPFGDPVAYQAYQESIKPRFDFELPNTHLGYK